MNATLAKSDLIKLLARLRKWRSAESFQVEQRTQQNPANKGGNVGSIIIIVVLVSEEGTWYVDRLIGDDGSIEEHVRGDMHRT